jgi:Bacterial Ig-like domain (group 3)/FG-GAP-like repeat
MSLFSRFLRCPVLCLLCMISGVCAAQQTTQFLNLAGVQPTGGRVTSFLAGVFQQPPSRTDFLYVNAPVGSGVGSSVTAGVQLSGQGFTGLIENQITFTHVSNVVATQGDFNGDGYTDFAFALTPSGSTTTNLCVYYGTGANVASQMSSFSGGGVYPAQGISGCMTFPTVNGLLPPKFTYIAAMPLLAGSNQRPQLLVEDSANSVLYVISNSGSNGSLGQLSGFNVMGTTALADGAGPIYTGDFDHDGNMDFIVNGQTGYSATVYFGNGNGTFKAPVRYVFDDGVRSMLMQDMDGDRLPDMVVETNHGVIEIHKGAFSGTFAQGIEGGTAASPGSVAGEGGHLAAINPNTLDILTTTPIGLSLLRDQGSRSYGLKTIYNIGPGRSSFALAGFLNTNNLDLAVDSAEGVAIIPGNPDGTFQASNGYAALAPGLGATVGQFRNPANNPMGNLDVVVGTGATQAQLLQGKGDGTFAALNGPVNTLGNPPNVPPTVWSNILSGDFDGDGNLDLLYSLTGLPQPSPSGTFPVLYFQYGIGDGTFAQAGFPFTVSPPGSNNNGFYLETAVGDFDGDGASDAASSDAFFDGTGLSCKGFRNFPCGGFSVQDSSNANFSQVATGFFKNNRKNQQDIVFEQGANCVPYANKQDGTGSYFPAEPVLIGPGGQVYPSTMLLTDIDGDGNSDLVVVYYNASSNPLGLPPIASNYVYIWYGNGDGTFQTPPQVLGLSRNYYLGAVADMNGDGFPDLVLSDGSVISILYNQGGRNFGTLLTSGLYSGEQHFLAGQGINSISLVDVNGDGAPDVVAANGGVTISNALAIGGKTASSISLAANPPDINTGGITVLINHIASKPVTGTLVASPEPSTYTLAFTMTATVTPAVGVALPTGTVTFSVDGVQVGNPVNLVPGTTNSTATYTIPQGNTYAGGVHAMTAYYSGDSANSPLTLAGAPGTHQIQNSGTTSYIVMCIGPTVLCPAPPGVPNPAPLYTPALPMYYGQIWNGFIGASANDGSALTGTIQLIDNYTGAAAPPPNPLCVLPIGGGACPNSVGTTQGTSVGLNVLTGYYPGDASHTASTSSPIAVTVLPDTTSATLTGSPNPSPALLPVTFTATVTGNYAAPTGPVAFYFGNTLLGQVNLVPSATGNTSTATLTTSILPVGNDLITATYGATMDFQTASATFTEIITPSLAGNFTVSVTPAAPSVGVGYSTLLVVTVTPLNGFSQGVNLSCANLPSEATCFFDTATLAAGGYTTDLVVSTTAPHSCGTSTPYFLGSNSGGPGVAPFALPAIAGLLAIFLPGRRRWLRALLAAFLVTGMTHLTGCGTCTDLGTRPATYTFQITGAATGTSEVEAQPVTITVTI